MLVIHIISTNDTQDFAKIYYNLDARICINPSKSTLKEELKREKECIVLIGHGTENGLLNQRLDGYIIDSSMVNFLRGKTIIGIWCYAGNFADKYNLKGFFTSNFISNTEELTNCGYEQFADCDKIIQDENLTFSWKINSFLQNKKPLNEWINTLQEGCNDYKFVKYNYEALYYDE